MFMSYQHPSYYGRFQRAAHTAGSAGPIGPVEPAIYRLARRHCERACCCSAPPAVVTVIPPGGDRRAPTDLLLCGHHYRLSMPALAAKGAIVLDLDGYPLPVGNWPRSR
jgi:hypothetical protein